MTDAKTINVYDAQIEKYRRLTAAQPSVSLNAFIELMPHAGRVLDWGCGPGLASASMAQAGLYVDAIDASVQMVQAAQTHQGVTATLGTFDDLQAVNIYDGVYANFSLLHAPRADFPRYLLNAHRALRDGGILHLGMKLGHGQGRDTLGRFYCYYTAPALCEALTQAGFNIINQYEGKEAGLAGSVDPFIIIQARRV